MAVLLSPYGGVGAQFLDNSGNVLTGGKIYTYAAGTTTPQVTYTSSNGATPHSNPIILDASGRVPSGEIWLTDGLVYKFVLTTSTDVLIATYDGIVGINSNFVAFTNQQEIQTATAGQTVFNLATMTYQPGTNSLSVFVDGVNQYGPGASYAYLETDSDTVTFVTGLHVGAEVKFTTSQLNSSVSSTNAFQISYVPPFTGSAATNVGLKLAQTVSVKDFGAVGDGVADDTAAIQAAIASGQPLNWGQNTYRITDQISASITSELSWVSDGSTIFLDAPSSVAATISLSFAPGTHKITGVLKIDCNRKSYSGFTGVVTTPTINIDDCPNFIATDLQVFNSYRAGTTFGGGDGIAVSGGFNRIELVRPVVVDAAVAAGASIITSVGATGITIGRDNTNELSARQIVITDPYVDRVYSEDPTVNYDMDGIRIFQFYNSVGDDPTESSAVVRGGLIKNSRNRSIKMQTQFGRIEGVKLEKDASIDIGSAGFTRNAEIDFQVGGGFVSDIECDYNGFVPINLILYTESVSATKKVPGMFVSGIRAVTSSPIPVLFRTAHSAGVNTYVANFERAHIIGGVNYALVCGTSSTGGKARAAISDIWAEINTAGVQLNGSGDLFVTATNVQNIGSDVPLTEDTGINPNQQISALNCTGFINYPYLSAGKNPPIPRLYGFTVAETEAPIGSWKIHSVNLAPSEEFTVPFRSAVNGTHGLMMVTVTGNVQSIGMFAFSSAGPLKLTSEGSLFTLGTTSDPGSGVVRIWGSSSGPVVKNGSVTDTRNFTILTQG